MKKAKAAAAVKVVQRDDQMVAVEVLAESIVKISAGVREALGAGLNRRCIVSLLHASTGVSRGEIGRVLNGLTDLRKDFTTR